MNYDLSSMSCKEWFLTFYAVSLVQGVGNNDDKVLVLAATNTPYALDQVWNIPTTNGKSLHLDVNYSFDLLEV